MVKREERDANRLENGLLRRGRKFGNLPGAVIVGVDGASDGCVSARADVTDDLTGEILEEEGAFGWLATQLSESDATPLSTIM